MPNAKPVGLSDGELKGFSMIRGVEPRVFKAVLVNRFYKQLEMSVKLVDISGQVKTSPDKLNRGSHTFRSLTDKYQIV